MRRIAARDNSPKPDETGFAVGQIVSAVHVTTGKEISGTYAGLSKSKMSLKIGDTYVNKASYQFTLTE